MAKHYVGAGRDQLFLLPVSMREWLAEGHLAWFVIDVVAAVDTSAFHALHPNDGPGRPAYDPEVMLALLFYAYGVGLRSSRRIEAACRTDAAFRVIAGNATPDHATIARFVVDHEAAIEAVFVDVLRLCAAAGLVSVTAIAIDGTKVGSDAALDRNRTRAEVARILAEAKAADAADAGPAGLFGSDMLPAALSSRAGRAAALQAAVDRLDAEDAADQADHEARVEAARQAARQGHKLRGRKPKDPHTALGQAEAELDALNNAIAARVSARAALEAQRAATGTKPPGPKPGEQRAMADEQAVEQAEQRVAQARAAAAESVPSGTGKINLTDPESRIMKTAAGWVQGYNAQAAVNANQIVVACAVTQQENDQAQYQPMVAAARAALDAAGITDHIALVLADAGYCSETNLTADGPERLIATTKDHKQRRAARALGTTTGPPPPDASPIDAMEHRLRTPEGAAAYTQRSHTVEPVFGDHKENRGFRRFRRRGLDAARSEWALWNTSHNIAKLLAHKHSQPTPA